MIDAASLVGLAMMGAGLVGLILRQQVLSAAPAGPYRWFRHPIDTSVCLFVWACVVGYPSWFAVGMASLVTSGGVVRMLAEESRPRRRYPEYADYARKTSRMVPYVF